MNTTSNWQYIPTTTYTPITTTWYPYYPNYWESRRYCSRCGCWLYNGNCCGCWDTRPDWKQQELERKLAELDRKLKETENEIKKLNNKNKRKNNTQDFLYNRRGK